MCLSFIRNSDEDHSCLNLESLLDEEESNMQHQRMLSMDINDTMLHLKGTETHPASYTSWPVTWRNKACPLGPGGRAVLSCESRMYFANLPLPPCSSTPGSPGLWGHRWCLHPTKAGSEVTLTPPLLHLVFNHTVKEFSLQGAPDPCCPLHPHSPAHSHTWIPAITSLGSQLQTHTPISSPPSTFHLANSHFRICFLLWILPWCPNLQGKLQTLLSEFKLAHGLPEVTPTPQSQVSHFLPSQWYWCSYTTHTDIHTHMHTCKK